MEENKELAIGEIGVIDGVRAKCVPRSNYYTSNNTWNRTRNCIKCVFAQIERGEVVKCNAPKGVWCHRDTRSDHTDVYFKKID